jgi:hypothetical protein
MATHDNQLNDDNAAYDDKVGYNDNKHDDNTAYNDDVASGVVIEPTPAQLGQQCLQNNGKDSSPMTPVQ